MIIIRNNIIPFTGYKSINLCGVLFVRKNAVMSDTDLRHEEIHSKQIFEMLIVGFYLWYVIEWLVRSIVYIDMTKAYKHMAFEREAYDNEDDEEYLEHRKHYAWLEYL